MWKRFFFLFIFCFGGSIAAHAQCIVEDSYVARLSASDHFNSNGGRLTEAAAIIRQDRANYHVFQLADPEDQSDRFFDSKQNRSVLERLLQNGRSTPGAIAEIVNGTPMVLVQVCRSASGSEYVTVSIIEAPGQCDQKDFYVARLGAEDHFNSSGVRLDNAPAIIRQDRANFFVFNKRDPEDQSDTFFNMKESREMLEKMLENGKSTPETLAEIINGTPLIFVSVCQQDRSYYIDATVIEK